MGKNNIIEINGRRYDVHTGAPVDGTVNTGQKPVSDTARPVQVSQPTAKRVPVHTTASAKPLQTNKVRVHDAVKAHSQTRRQQRSKTLMRSVVAKPADSLKRHTKAQSHVDALVDKPAARLQPKTSVHRISDRRLQHAETISRSEAFSRFSRPHGPSPDPPVHLPARQPKPVEFPASHLSAVSYDAKPHSLSLDEIVEHALETATSHLELPPASRRRRLFWRTTD